MTWRHGIVLVVCLVSVMACGFHPGCVAVLPQISTLATFIAGGALGNAQASTKG